MKVYDDIKDMLCDELQEIAKKKELTTNSLEVLYKGVDILKDLSTIKAMEQEYGYSQDGGYSQGYWNRTPFYMYDGDMSHGRSYAQRDERGRYSSDYSRNDGYSGDTREELRQMMNRASNDKEREAIRKALDSMSM